MPYETAEALRAALEDRLKNQSRQAGVDLERLRRHTVFERFLVRLDVADPGRWILKGGMAVEFRLGDRARATRDLDLAMRGNLDDGDEARDALIEALAADPDGDHFELRGRSTRAASSRRGGTARLALLARRQAGRPTLRRRAARRRVATRRDRRNRAITLPGTMAFAGMPDRDVEVVNRRQQFAEKLHALTRTYGDRPSSRVRDLPDLVLLIEDGLAPDADLLARVRHVFDVRGTHVVPEQIPDPPADWADRYASLAGDLDVMAASLSAAMRLLRGFWSQALGSAG